MTWRRALGVDERPSTACGGGQRVPLARLTVPAPPAPPGPPAPAGSRPGGAPPARPRHHPAHTWPLQRRTPSLLHLPALSGTVAIAAALVEAITRGRHPPPPLPRVAPICAAPASHLPHCTWSHCTARRGARWHLQRHTPGPHVRRRWLARGGESGEARSLLQASLARSTHGALPRQGAAGGGGGACAQSPRHHLAPPPAHAPPSRPSPRLTGMCMSPGDATCPSCR